jgi:hypothetical protein
MMTAFVFVIPIWIVLIVVAGSLAFVAGLLFLLRQEHDPRKQREE